MPAASTSMVQRWPVVLNFNQYRMNGGLALPTARRRYFKSRYCWPDRTEGAAPGGQHPPHVPSPGRPQGDPPPVGCAPRKTRRTWSSGPPSGPEGAAAAAQRRPSAGRERPQ